MPNVVKNILVIFIVLASITFFQLAVLGESMYKMIELAGIGVILVFVIVHLVYDRNEGFKLNFKYEIFTIFFALILSMFMAEYGHGQSMSTTAIAQRSMYFYFFYFFLHFVKVRTEDLEKIIVGISIAYAVLFLMQFLLYPRIIFNVRIGVERGTLRIFLPGLAFLLMAFFYGINKILFEQKYLYLLLCGLLLIIIVLLGTRQILATVMLVTILNVVFSGTLKSKVLLSFLAVLAIIPIFFLFQNIFIELFSLSQHQASGFEEDVRVRAATFFLTDFYPNRLAYITGNGVHSLNSSYGVQVEGYKENFGFYQSDIGIIGEFTKYGLFFVVAILVVLVKVVFKRAGKEVVFIKYYFIYLIITLLISGEEFSSPGSIVPNLIGLYMIDVSLHNLKSKTGITS